MSARFVTLGPSAALAEGAHASYEADGHYVLVYRIQGTLYAIEDRCTHDDNPLDDAVVEGLEVICPRHGARFCLRTGAALSPPAYEAVRCYTVVETDGELRLQVDP